MMQTEISQGYPLINFWLYNAIGKNTLMTADLTGGMDSGTDCMIGPWFWPSGRGPVIWK